MTLNIWPLPLLPTLIRPLTRLHMRPPCPYHPESTCEILDMDRWLDCELRVLCLWSEYVLVDSVPSSIQGDYIFDRFLFLKTGFKLDKLLIFSSGMGVYILTDIVEAAQHYIIIHLKSKINLLAIQLGFSQ